MLLAVDTMLGGDFSVQPAWELLTRGNWLIRDCDADICNHAVLYPDVCNPYVGEKDGMTPGEAVRRSLRALPRLFALLLLLAVPAMMTGCWRSYH